MKRIVLFIAILCCVANLQAESLFVLNNCTGQVMVQKQDRWIRAQRNMDLTVNTMIRIDKGGVEIIDKTTKLSYQYYRQGVVRVDDIIKHVNKQRVAITRGGMRTSGKGKVSFEQSAVVSMGSDDNLQSETYETEQGLSFLVREYIVSTTQKEQYTLAGLTVQTIPCERGRYYFHLSNHTADSLYVTIASYNKGDGCFFLPLMLFDETAEMSIILPPHTDIVLDQFVFLQDRGIVSIPIAATKRFSVAQLNWIIQTNQTSDINPKELSNLFLGTLL